jgi:hypothetical protein
MKLRHILPIAVLLATPAVYAAPATCTVEKTNYLGWEAEQMSNAWVKLIIVPQLGGRLMQVTFNGHDFLYVNDQLKGQRLDPATTGHRWINYGGDKIWPMPEGSDDEQHWAGAGGAVLDNGVYKLDVLAHGRECAVRLTGPADPAIGQQYIRDIAIDADSPVIRFHAVMKNVSGYPQTWSEQSVSQYNAASATDSAQFNTKFWGVTPANPASQYLNAYHVRTGESSNGSYTVADGLFKAQWSAKEGEVWVDSNAGWLAVVDGTSGYTMVERIRYDRHADYPGKATMIFYTSGRPMPRSGGTSRPPILYMEAEINSPMIELAPGESYAMDTQWFPALMGGDFKTAAYSGVVGTALAATHAAAGVTLSGSFGVFYAGQLVAHFYSRGGESLGTAPIGPATPLQPTHLQATLAAPAETARVSVHVVDTQGLDRGPLGEALVTP